MRWKLLLLLVLVAFEVDASKLRATFDYKIFYVAGQGNMIECYFNFDGSTLKFAETTEGFFQSRVESTLILKRHSEIVDFQKSEVKSPEIQGDVTIDFFDQRRLVAPNGDYILEITLIDLNDLTGEKVQHEIPISIRNSKSDIFISDIELVAGYSEAIEDSKWAKSGMDLIPFLSSHYGEEFDELIFYAEIYNAIYKLGENEQFLLSYFIEDIDTEQIVANIIQRKKVNSELVTVLFSKLNISELPNGKFNLVIEARNKLNEVISEKKKVISRYNPNLFIGKPTTQEVNETFVGAMNNKEQLREYIQALHPITSQMENGIIENTLEGLSLLEMKSFFFTFWSDRDANNPEYKWLEYKRALEETDVLFSTRLKRGWQTDRGYVYLKYGKPNTVADKTREEDAYPYYIWHYYKAGKFNNGKFVFYNRDIGQEDFELLHSNVRGERTNSKWNLVLHSRNTPDVNFFRDQTTPDQNSGRDAEDTFANPW